jgi:asparagine synthase (glutamine-hydrolysing)
MSDIVGQIAFDGDSIPEHIARQAGIERALPHETLLGPTTYSNESGAIAIKGYPRLGSESDTKTVARRVLEAYLSGGSAILEKLRGPFAVVIFHPELRKCLIAIDRMGIERLAWSRAKGWISVGSSAADVAHSQHKNPSLNQQALFSFMYSHMVPAPDTVFENVAKLMPGNAIEFSADGQREYAFWQPNFERDDKVDIAQLSEQTRPILRAAIERTGPDRLSGTFLSGGLDSSTVTGLLSEVQSEQTRVFSVGFGVEEYDEMEFARAAASHFDCQHNVYEVTPGDVVDMIPKIAAAYDEPFGNSSAVPTYCCARLAREHGVTHLLGGDGGDELFGGNERYIRHRVFEMYQHVPGWLRAAVFRPIARKIDPESGLFPLRKISSYVQQARIQLPERFESWNLIYREGADRIFSGQFLESVNPAALFERMNDVWQSCPSDDLLDKMLWYDWKFTLADNDVRKVSRMCELAGVRVSYPMLDEDFVEHSMKVPSSAKIRRYELRTFFKNAVRGYVPDMIINKEKHGFGLPFGIWLKADKPLQDLVYGSIESLRQRTIFDPAFLDRVMSEHKDGHASYYGYAIWDLVMLEQWLLHHVP